METITAQPARTWPGLSELCKILLLFFCFSFFSFAGPATGPQFELSFPSSVHAAPITGRVFVIVTASDLKEPRFQAGWWGDTPPLFGVDVHNLKPGEVAIIDSSTLGYPVNSLRDIPAGDYYVQAILNVYTQFHRADGHTIWAHLDHWEGQQFSKSPGNLYSRVQEVHLDPASGYDIKLPLSEVIPPISAPPDTAHVKHIKIQSGLLSRFWGRPIDLGATVLLPKGYRAHPGVRYPIIYLQGHFSLKPPFGFEEPGYNDSEKASSFTRAWFSSGFPRMIVVTFQHPTPYFDDSYAVNSANDGPYGNAIMNELIPAVESRFRVIREPYARLLTGGSTGGWESLALQLYHPRFFGGVWCLYPDPIDFRNYGLLDIYTDDNAFWVPHRRWLPSKRYIMRDSNGQPEVSTQKFSQLEAVLGTHGRSCQQLEAWEAVFGPVGSDGYPVPLWDKLTGKINPEVASTMRQHGYDLRAYLAANWPRIGQDLVGKLHFFVGDMDNYYLNLAVYRMQAFLKTTTHPHDEGSFTYGRPMKGHGWSPMSNAELLRNMAKFIKEHAPQEKNTQSWNY